MPEFDVAASRFLTVSARASSLRGTPCMTLSHARSWAEEMRQGANYLFSRCNVCVSSAGTSLMWGNMKLIK